MVLPDDTIIYKIGMTNSNRSVKRMLEILHSWFSSYRFIPYSELRLDMECTCPAELEKHIHRVLDSHQFIPHKKVSGGTEMFTDLDEIRVLHYIRNYNHELIVNGLNLKDQDYRNLCQLLCP